ncbi:aminotransferase-like domain-containing protein [Acuticoccus mangrovi]|uniref:PLP-dependent aminotransferase family protein n=1 Tax=Acuticoccus mangrovi TaxID=2796142 RepID=A0A934MBI1_9HYPH|nr:PLP-dependent aminotransferase family protein [Acuticoccus mangrovi]MBJ3774147.1 PLP-dependent aminotransferase family protein [Acuticoccus mangrovi]
MATTQTDANGTDMAWLDSVATRPGAKYVAIVDSLAEAILAGRLPMGERLPAHRELAQKLGVTVATVTKAFAELARQGYVVTRRGSGTYVTRPAVVAAGAQATASGPVDLAVNRPPSTIAAPFLKEALQEVAEGDMVDVFGYEAVGGAAAARATGCAWLAERGIEAAPDSVFLTAGGNQGLMAALSALCRPGERVVTEAVNYTGIRRMAHLLGIELMPVVTDGKGMVPEALEAAAAASGARVVLATPVTHNPTGVSMDGARRSAIAEVVTRADLLMVEDDIYGHLAAADADTFYARLPSRTLHVTSLSKSISSGLRVGWLAVPDALASAVRDALYGTEWTAPALPAAVAGRLIAAGAHREIIARHREEAEWRRTLALNLFGDLIDPMDSPSYHVWLRLDPTERADAIHTELLREGIAVSPAHHFVIGEAVPPNALRLSLGAVKERAELRTALERVARRLAGARTAIGAIA